MIGGCFFSPYSLPVTWFQFANFSLHFVQSGNVVHMQPLETGANPFVLVAIEYVAAMNGLLLLSLLPIEWDHEEVSV